MNIATILGKIFGSKQEKDIKVIKPTVDKVNELASITMARDITKKIEENMDYPGQIKVTVVRETRATEFAK